MISWQIRRTHDTTLLVRRARGTPLDTCRERAWVEVECFMSKFARGSRSIYDIMDWILQLYFLFILL